jgi:hypothetical protein
MSALGGAACSEDFLLHVVDSAMKLIYISRTSSCGIVDSQLWTIVRVHHLLYTALLEDSGMQISMAAGIKYLIDFILLPFKGSAIRVSVIQAGLCMRYDSLGAQLNSRVCSAKPC